MASPAVVSHSGSITTPEYLAFQTNYEVLIETVKAEPDRICDALFGKGYISSGVRDYVRTVGITSGDKARKLVDTVIDQIRHNPDVFHGFINMPINQTDFTNSAIQKLKESFETELKKQKDSPRLSFQEDMKSMSELSSHLRSCGLDDSDYWLQQLKEHRVQSITSLRHLEGDTNEFPKLLTKVRGSVENKALYKLLKIDKPKESKKSESIQKEKEMNMVQAREKWAIEKKETRVQNKPTVARPAPDEQKVLKQESTVPEKYSQPTIKPSDKNELFSYIRSHGLSDCQYWLTQLEKLGVQSKAALIHLEDDMGIFTILNTKARNSVEKQCLASLLNISPKSKPKQQLRVITKKADTNPLSLENALKTSCLPGSKMSYLDNSDARILLERLGLIKYYPKMLRLQDAQCIKLEPLMLSLGKKCVTDSKQLPQLVLHKLLAYDSQCRSDLMPVIDYQSSDESDSDENRSNCSENSRSSVSYGIHPIDNLLSLVICSDDFLRQDLFSRLAKCQLAVPFIIPDPFTKELTLPLWGLRSIIKEWDCTKASGEVIKKMQPIIMYKMPIITFIRVGKHHQNRSKSAILNEVISDSHYDHFFHRDCEGGDYNLVLGDGLVDMCWYLPGKTALAFPDAVTFLNLHGDAREHPEQMRFLSQISSMCFVLLTEEGLELDNVTAESLERFGSSAGGITVLSSSKKINDKSLNKKRRIDLKKNVSGIKNYIRSLINEKLDGSQSFQSIEHCCDTKERILIDEHSESYRQGLSHATKLKMLITSHQSKATHKTKFDQKSSGSSAKDYFLPLQGEALWKAWAADDKEMQRQILRGNKSVNQYTEEIYSKKIAIRKKQLVHVKTLTPVMESFLESLLRFGGPSNRILRNYFLQCLKLELNNLSRESMSDMQHQYQATRKELSIFQEKTVSRSDQVTIDLLKKKIENLQEDIISSSFGLEHLFRELGQVYEAAAYEPQYYQDILCRLPRAAAELLIDGYPLELMDGDAAHVPLQWVTAVLEETTKMLDDPNVFVLSVLGVQGTGGSTMLNTVFGLQFNASTGRYTPGAFMQLLPLEEELKKQTSCSYILLVDTEGLRAPQLDPEKTQKHDNELATFVIGLANMTLINISGEVAADMDNILQTSVHAFLRMTEINFTLSCQFVHQNAGPSVSGNMGLSNLSKRLDHFTVEAAKQEKCEERFRSFNDIIKFNDQSDVHYFRGLWKGDPPMAPVNPGYSQSAQKLKLHLVEKLCKIHSEMTSDLHLSAFKVKVKDLWEALLQENFIFSFKNIQEITAYHSLESKYGDWDWEFQKAMLKWERMAEKELSAMPEEDVGIRIQLKYEELDGYMMGLHVPIKEQMKEFFSGNQKEILAQWKKKFELRINDLKEELMEHAKRHCWKIGKSKQAILKFKQDTAKYAAIITSQVPEHIARIKAQEQKMFHECLQKGVFDLELLEKIYKRKIFTFEMLEHFKEQRIISQEEVQLIQAIINECGGQLTQFYLKRIVEKLETEQVKKMLIDGKQTEEELKKEYDNIWRLLIEEIKIKLSLLPSNEDLESRVEQEVEETLHTFVNRLGYGGQLLAELREQKKIQRECGAIAELRPIEKIHYNKVPCEKANPISSVVAYLFKSKPESSSDFYLVAAHEMTKKVISRAKKCLLDIVREEKTDFQSTCVQELLRTVDDAITKESEAEHIKKWITITHAYRRAVLIVVCRHSAPMFINMAKAFLEQTNPLRLIYLENNVKMPLFVQFKNQYNQTKAEEAIASTLCAHLEAPIKEQIRERIGALIVGKMRASDDNWFSSKMALKVKVLTDLYEKGNYESYIAYIQNVKEYLQKQIKYYTEQYADEVVSGGTRLQIIAKEEVDVLIAMVANRVKEVNKLEIREWLDSFSKMLISELGDICISINSLLIGFDSLNEMNLDNFRLQIQTKLRDLSKNLHSFYANIKCKEDMSEWRDQPHNLLDGLLGCTEQCPFCGEQCDLQDPNHFNDKKFKHRTQIHRPTCLRGWRDTKTQVMVSNFCNSLVSSPDREFLDKKYQHPYQQYETVFPEWTFLPILPLNVARTGSGLLARMQKN